jgi:cell division initiation protein
LITPLDIQNKKFKKKVLGYCQEEVDEFLDQVNESHETLYRENIELKDKVSTLNEAIQHYKSIEETLQNTLLVAQTTGEEVKRNAYEKSDSIVRDAEMNAKKIIEDANQEVIKIRYEYENIRKEMGVFKAKMNSLLMSEMEMIKENFIEKNQEVQA